MKLLLIGCWRISVTHLEALKADGSEFTLVGVCDINSQLAQKLGQENNVPFYDDYKIAIDQSDCDIVDICTWSGEHPLISVYASNKWKHVISEKPMALTLTESDAMISAAEQNNKKLFVIKQNRLNETIILLKKAIDAWRFGKIYQINSIVNRCRPQDYYDQSPRRWTWKYDWWAFMNQSSHYVDMMHYLWGAVKNLYWQTKTLARKIESEDSWNALFEFESWTIGNINVTMLVHQKNREGSITIIGEKWVVKVWWTSLNKIEEWAFDDYQQLDDYAKWLVINPPNVYGFGHKNYFQHIYNEIQTWQRNKRIADWIDWRKSLELILGIYESAIIEKPVELPLSYDTHIERLILSKRK